MNRSPLFRRRSRRGALEILRDISILGLWLAFGFGSLSAAPFTPKSDSQVLETLRTRPLAPVDRELRRLRALQRASPNDITNAVALAGVMIGRARAEADPRWLSQAQGVLLPWWTNTVPPNAVLFHRATIRQSLHDFDGALADLRTLLQRDPAHGGAWLAKTTIHTVRAEYPAARSACFQLARHIDDLTALGAVAQIGSLTGDAPRSYHRLRDRWERPNSARGVDSERALWILTQLGEMAGRLGLIADAESHFQAALQIAPSDPYLLGAYSDFLLDSGKLEPVVDLLWRYTRVDALLLRLTEAESRTRRNGDSEWRKHVQILHDRFSDAAQRGDVVHRREEARFRLHLENDADAALALARDNWKVQREPADARIFLEAAWASQKPDAADPVLEWRQSNHVEDLVLDRLAGRESKP
ncbi:MAG: hypothetical protein EXS36_06710 [Pedosphaera sp.]|nr:hypothetical protein [Pedosphaera sp.]